MAQPENQNRKVYKVTKIKAISIGAVLFIFALVLGYSAGYFRTYAWTKKLVSKILPLRENNFNYKFIYPLLTYTFGDARYLLEDKILEQKIKDYIQIESKNGNVKNVSVYFRNLLNNNWSGVDSTTQYHPGSIMKVLIMIAYYRQSQLDSRVLDKTFDYSQNINQQTESLAFGQPTSLKVGQSYSLRQLLEAMIEDSDNGAETLLLDNVDHKILNYAYSDLNLQSPDDVEDYTISAEQYAAFLRILYNSTYLTETNSEEVLSIMSKSNFHDGISAGVPSEITVSQKYGERVDLENSNHPAAVELHNCGIIYAKAYPYILCIMTKGSAEGGTEAEKRLATIIKNISSIVYNYVSVEKN